MHLGLIGYGSIATALLERLPGSGVTGATVLLRPGSAARNAITAAQANSGIAVSAVTTLDAFLKARPDLTVECAGHGAVAGPVPDLLAAGCDVIVASVGALADDGLSDRLSAAAAAGSARMILPGGAIGGLDLLQVLARSGPVDVTYRGTKPPAAWAGSRAEDLTDLSALTTATTFFTGSARQAALAFPKNANVVAALALAGAGFDRMAVELVADPEATGNRHSYDVTSPLCSYRMVIDAAPTAGNARTSMTTVFSILHEIATWKDTRRGSTSAPQR